MSIFEQIEAEMPGYLDEFTDLKLDIAEAIDAHLKSKGMSQKDLAQAIGKSEAEVSKWLSGLHNLTLRSIAKMQYALGERVISVTIPEVAAVNTFPWQFAQMKSDNEPFLTYQTASFPGSLVSFNHPSVIFEVVESTATKQNLLAI